MSEESFTNENGHKAKGLESSAKHYEGNIKSYHSLDETDLDKEPEISYDRNPPYEFCQFHPETVDHNYQPDVLRKRPHYEFCQFHTEAVDHEDHPDELEKSQIVDQEIVDNIQSDKPRKMTYTVLEEPDPEEPVKTYAEWARTFWLTQQMGELANKELRVQTTLQELIYYLCFLLIFNIISLGTTNPSLYFQTEVLEILFLKISGRLIAFREISQMKDVWDFTRGPFLAAYNGDSWYMQRSRSRYFFVRRLTDEEMNTNILYMNKMLGLIRLRQVRSRNDSCDIHEEMKRFFSRCYDYYSPASEDTTPFGPGNSTAWTYSTAEETGMDSYEGEISEYGGGGYYVDLPKKLEKTHRLIEHLVAGKWIDRGTRAVFFDFTIYNPHVNLFTVMKLILEFPPTGGVYPSKSVRAVDLIRYSQPFDFFILACEIILCIFIIYFTLEEIREIIYFGWIKYFTDFRTYIDLLILGLSYCYIGVNIHRYISFQKQLNYYIEHQNEYTNFDTVSYWQDLFESLESITVFICWVKLFRFISFNKTMSQLSSTLYRCAWDIAGFSIIFFIVFCAFAQLAYLLFGTMIERFSTFVESMFSLLRIILQDFDYEELERARPVLGPLFFFIYIFFVFFILLNMFLAIINDTYSEVKSEVTAAEEYEVSDLMYRGLINVMEKLGFKKKVPKEETEEEKEIYRKIRKELKKRDISDLEIDMFLSKYGLHPTQDIGEDEISKLLSDLQEKELRPKTFFRSEVVTEEEYQLLEDKIHATEDSVVEIIHKFDVIIKKLNELKRPKIIN